VSKEWREPGNRILFFKPLLGLGGVHFRGDKDTPIPKERGANEDSKRGGGVFLIYKEKRGKIDILLTSKKESGIIGKEKVKAILGGDSCFSVVLTTSNYEGKSKNRGVRLLEGHSSLHRRRKKISLPGG